TQVDPGVAATLSWTTQQATSASIDQGVGAVALPSGTQSVTPNPQTDTTYTLTGQGPNGPVTAQVTLVVNSVKLSANAVWQGIDNAGYDSYYYTLNWSTQNATSVQLYDSLHNTTTPVGASGSITVYTHQESNTPYTLTAWGPGQSPVSVTVECAGPIQPD
ncbi:MAG: hypothetical protein LC731_04115, partial [Acidobacteria bacterium]|nr:hypothetical protein [Acidobacteriota bacterium]